MRFIFLVKMGSGGSGGNRGNSNPILIPLLVAFYYKIK